MSYLNLQSFWLFQTQINYTVFVSYHRVIKKNDQYKFDVSLLS